MRWFSSFTALLCVALWASSLDAQQWGDLTMQFTYDGAAPRPVPATVNKDQNFCGKFGLLDESLVVNKDNGGLANVIVFLYVGRGDKQPSVHPDYAKSAKAKVKLDNAKCRFEPRVAVLRTSQTLELGNSDPVGHNSNITTLSPANPAQNLLIPSGRSEELNFAGEERLPCKVSCNIHPWMGAWLVVKEHPYVGVSDQDGKVLLKNVPTGNWTFQIWQEKAGYVREVKLNGKTTSWSRGRFEHTIKPGQNDLGEVKVSPSIFD